MTNTPFSNKCAIITEFSELYSQEDWTQDFFAFYNLGVPWAIGAHYGDITLNERGIEYVDQAWQGLLKMFDLDPYAEFDDLVQLLEVSNESR